MKLNKIAAAALAATMMIAPLHAAAETHLAEVVSTINTGACVIDRETGEELQLNAYAGHRPGQIVELELDADGKVKSFKYPRTYVAVGTVARVIGHRVVVCVNGYYYVADVGAEADKYAPDCSVMVQMEDERTPDKPEDDRAIGIVFASPAGGGVV